MAAPDSKLPLNKVSSEIDEAECKIIYTNQCIKAQEALRKKLMQDIKKLKEKCHFLKVENLKLEAKMKDIEKEIDSSSKFTEAIKGSNVELRKELLLRKEYCSELVQRVKDGEKKYHTMWLEAKQRFESNPLVQQWMKATQETETLNRKLDALDQEMRMLNTKEREKKRQILAEERKLIINLAEFMTEYNADMKKLKDEQEEFTKLSTEVETLKAKQSTQSASDPQMPPGESGSHHDSSMMPKRPKPTTTGDEVLDMKLDLKKAPTQVTPIKKTISMSASNRVTSDAVNERYMSCYFSKLEDTASTSEYSKEKLISIMDVTELDDKNGKGSLKMNVETRVAVDVSAPNHTGIANMSMEQAAKGGRKNKPKEEVSFETPVSASVHDISDDDDECQPDNTLATVTGTPHEDGTDNNDGFVNLRKMLLKKRTLDLSPQFVYGKKFKKALTQAPPIKKTISMSASNRVTSYALNELYMSCYFSKLEDTDSTSEYSEEKLLSILGLTELDDKNAKGSPKDDKEPIVSEEKEEIDLTARSSQTLSPSQFADMNETNVETRVAVDVSAPNHTGIANMSMEQTAKGGRKNKPKEEVSFETPVSASVHDISDDDDECQPDNTLATVTGTPHEDGTDNNDGFINPREMLLKKRTLDLSPQFVYGKKFKKALTQAPPIKKTISMSASNRVTSYALNELYMSCYFSKLEDTDSTSEYSEEKLLSILGLTELDDKNAKGSPKDDEEPIVSEEKEEIDLTARSSQTLSPSQFADMNENAPKERVSFETPVSASVHDISDDDDECQPDNTLATVTGTPHEDGTDNNDGFINPREMLLKKRTLDLSPQFVYGKKKTDENVAVVRSKFFETDVGTNENKKDEKSKEKDKKDKINELEGVPGKEEANEKQSTAPTTESVNENYVDIDGDKMKSPSEKQPVVGMLFTHGPEGIPDYDCRSTSTNGYEEGDADFPQYLDSSDSDTDSSMSPLSPMSLSGSPPEVQPHEVPNFLSDLMKSGFSFVNQNLGTSSEANPNNQENSFNFNFDGGSQEK